MSHHNEENHSKASAGKGDLGDRRKPQPAEGGCRAAWREGRDGETLGRMLCMVGSASDPRAGGEGRKSGWIRDD